MKRTESWPGPGGSTPRLHHKRTSRQFGIAPKLGLDVRFWWGRNRIDWQCIGKWRTVEWSPYDRIK